MKNDTAAVPVETLREALERTLGNFERLLAGKPVRDAAETIAEARAALSTPVVGPSGAMREALEWCAEEAWDRTEIDGGHFHDKMLSLGLFVEVPADDDFRDEWESDTMFVVAWHPLAVAALTSREPTPSIGEQS